MDLIKIYIYIIYWNKFVYFFLNYILGIILIKYGK